MNDYIERQEAIGAVCEHGTELERRGITVLAVVNHKQVTIDLLESLPSVQPQRWIPVAEALPDEDGYYLVTGKRESVYITGYSNGRWYGGTKPIAWMPLPPSYKGDKK